MSGFTLGGMFNMGALDFSNMDFSNIKIPTQTPEPTVVAEPDPVDIVSNNTPNVAVEVNEPTGDLTFTEDSTEVVEDLTNVLIPDMSVAPTGMNFGLGGIEVSSENIPTSVVGESSLQAGFDAGGTRDTLTTYNESQFNKRVKDLALQTESPFDTEAVFEARDSMTGAEFTNYLNQIASTDKYKNFIDDSISSISEETKTGSDILGIDPDSVSTRSILQQKMLLPSYFTGDGTVKLQEDGTYKFIPKVDDPLVNIAVGIGMGMMTGGIAGAAGAMAGTAGSAIATGVTNAAVNAGLQQVVTGDVDWNQAAMAGIDAGISTANANAAQAVQAAEQAAEAATVIGATQESIQIASDLAQVAQEATAVADIANTIQTTMDIVEAVESKDIVDAIDLGLSLTGSSTVSNIVNENLASVGVPTDYLDVATSTVITAVDTAIKGGDVGDVVQESVNDILINTVATEDNIRETFSLDTTGFGDTLTKTLSSLTKEALEGGNREDILVKGLEAFVKNLPESDRESPEYLKQVEEWWHENIEDPFESWWQSIEPAREVVEQAVQNTVDVVKNVAEQAVTVVDTAVRALPPTKEDLEKLVDDVKETVVDPTVDVVRETGRQAEEVYDVAEDFVKEEVAPVVRETGRDIREAVPEVPDLPDVDIDPEITSRDIYYTYDDSDLVNPFMRQGQQAYVRDLLSGLELERRQQQAQRQRDEAEERMRRRKTVSTLNLNPSVRFT